MACSRMPKWKLRPAGILGAEIAGAFESQPRLARGPEVGRAAEQPRHVLGEGVQHLARGVAGGDAFGVGGKRRQVPVPALRQLAALHAIALIGELRILASILLELRPPGVVQRLAARADARLGSARARRRARGTSRPPASRSCAWSAGSPPRRAARRGPRWCPACSARRRRCGCRR